MECLNKLFGFVVVHVELYRELLNAHAIDQAEADSLGLLTINPCKVGDHLVKVSVRVLLISLSHLTGAIKFQQACIVN